MTRDKYEIVMENPEGKRTFRRLDVELKEMECEGVEWFRLAQDKGRVAGPCEQGSRPLRSIEFWEYPY
jgi:hypothetical protein